MKASWIASAVALAGIMAAGCELGPGDYFILRVNGGANLFIVVSGSVTQGPLTPVAQEGVPNEGPMAGAHVRVETTTGTRVGELVSDEEGRFAVQLEPGRYRFVPLPTTDAPFPAPPPPIELTINGPRALSFSYDTGIR